MLCDLGEKLHYHPSGHDRHFGSITFSSAKVSLSLVGVGSQMYHFVTLGYKHP